MTCLKNCEKSKKSAEVTLDKRELMSDPIENRNIGEADPRFGGYKSEEEHCRAVQIANNAESIYALCKKMQFLCGTLQMNLADWENPLPHGTDRMLSKASDKLHAHWGILHEVVQIHLNSGN